MLLQKIYHTSETKDATLTNVKFIHRFLMHVLPSGFQKIRYYDFLNIRYKVDKNQTWHYQERFVVCLTLGTPQTKLFHTILLSKLLSKNLCFMEENQIKFI